MAEIKEKVGSRRGNVSTYCTRRGSIVGVQSFFSESDGPYFRDDFSLNWCSRFLKSFWLKREEIKHFWRKISSSSWFSCILDSIVNRLRQVFHESLWENGWICSLNVERTTEKKPDKCAAIKAIWSSIFVSIGWAVWFLRPLNLGSLD